MADESIIDLKRPGFPKQSFTETGYAVTIEYVGIAADLDTAAPALNETWGDYSGIVVGAVLDPFEGSEYGILTVTIERKYDIGESAPEGVLQEVTTEIDWVDVQRSMYEHPEFRKGNGGTYELDDTDIAAIKSWEKNPDVEYKKIYIYREDGDYTQGVSSADPELSANAKMFAQGILLGIDYWVDPQPVVRWSGNYAGGPPPAESCGQKQDPIGVDGIPAGYEWIRSSDRGIKQGGQTRWTRNIEWLGSDKVLVDAKNIYWLAP